MGCLFVWGEVGALMQVFLFFAFPIVRFHRRPPPPPSPHPYAFFITPMTCHLMAAIAFQPLKPPPRTDSLDHLLQKTRPRAEHCRPQRKLPRLKINSPLPRCPLDKTPHLRVFFDRDLGNFFSIEPSVKSRSNLPSRSVNSSYSLQSSLNLLCDSTSRLARSNSLAAR